MAWDTTKSAGNVIASADWNAMVTDQKTRLVNGAAIGTTTLMPWFANLTTIQRDALTPTNGMIIYNTTTAQMEEYSAGAWSVIGISNHASLSNLNWAAAGHTIDAGVDFNSNALTEVASITINEDGWIGIGVASERLNFDGTAGEIQLGGAHLNVGANSIYGSGSGFTLGSTTSVPLIITVTTTQRDTLTPANGMIVYNSTATQFQKYEAGAWGALGGGVTDHGALTGLADDDHTQYPLAGSTESISGAWSFTTIPTLVAASAALVLRATGASENTEVRLGNTSMSPVDRWFFGYDYGGDAFQTGSSAVGQALHIAATGGHIRPGTAYTTGTQNFGDATWYWGDVSYKTLTDRGCLGWFDGGVELQDGSIVSDTAALKAIQKHPTKLTVYGVPQFDYPTMPKAVYKQGDPTKTNRMLYAEIDRDLQTLDLTTALGNSKLIQLNELQLRCEQWEAERGLEGPCGDDGAETTALISIMIGAIRELTTRMETIETKTASLPLIPVIK